MTRLICPHCTRDRVVFGEAIDQPCDRCGGEVVVVPMVVVGEA